MLITFTVSGVGPDIVVVNGVAFAFGGGVGLEMKVVGVGCRVHIRVEGDKQRVLIGFRRGNNIGGLSLPKRANGIEIVSRRVAGRVEIVVTVGDGLGISGGANVET